MCIRDRDCRGGVIDPGYRGNINVIMRNDTDVPNQVKKGSKIAQGIIEKFESTIPVETAELEGTQRSHKGFGSTTKADEQIKPIIKVVSLKSTPDEDKSDELEVKLPYNIFSRMIHITIAFSIKL